MPLELMEKLINLNDCKIMTIKQITIILLIFFSFSCSNKITNNSFYVLSKKDNSYNISIEFQEKRYKVKTYSTGSSGKTEGNWNYSTNHNILVLNPDVEEVFIETFDCDTVEIKKFRPFSDTLHFKIKKRKLIGISGSNLILHKTR